MNYKQMLDKFKEIELQLKLLEKRIESMERPFDRPFDGPYQPQIPPPTYPFNQTVCPTCGITLSGVMGYVCPNARCPTGLGGTWCQVNGGTT